MEIIAAIIGGLIAGVISWNIGRSDLGQKNTLLEAQLRDSNKEIGSMGGRLKSCNQKVNRLSKFEKKYKSVKEHLKKSSVVRTYSQPAILVGPRGVGKTSLLMQWHSPWDHSLLSATQTHRISTVPIYDFEQENTEPHFADSDILSDVHIHLKLRIHDSPGELSAQASIQAQARDETASLRQSTGKNLGIVLICMFDAEEAVTGLSDATNSYYNGELFANFKKLVAHNEISIDRLILNFNKYDNLKKHKPNQGDTTLLQLCVDTHKPIISLLRGICNPEKVCEVFTVLDRENMVENNRGAPIVLGEAARRFVEVMAGRQVMEKVVPEGASSFASSIFS